MKEAGALFIGCCMYGPVLFMVIASVLQAA